MNSHRIEELMSLLMPVWQQHNKLHLTEILSKLGNDMGHQKPLAELTDDQLIYHLKMLRQGKNDAIPGLAKDQEDDFKSALMQARGLDQKNP